jgi:hypothetical protein
MRSSLPRLSTSDEEEIPAASANGVEIESSSRGNRNDMPDLHSIIAPPSGWEDGKSGWKMVTPVITGYRLLKGGLQNEFHGRIG